MNHCIRITCERPQVHAARHEHGTLGHPARSAARSPLVLTYIVHPPYATSPIHHSVAQNLQGGGVTVQRGHSVLEQGDLAAR
ncbi:hypothetical protein AAFF_G00394420 [Aldrovandia affinis]|uniref:Uncharacterized protein n=1 Tax=Aldrovandia affinis TaxID=143900 RepID=A0AAD7SDU5_9TELE|nr:hypothetical protein AAFF_G00394420 [Aldrovandia affinis]